MGEVMVVCTAAGMWMGLVVGWAVGRVRWEAKAAAAEKETQRLWKLLQEAQKELHQMRVADGARRHRLNQLRQPREEWPT